MAAVPPEDLTRRLDAVTASTARLLTALEKLAGDDAAMREPSLLPGWTRGHVLAHLARNADALGRAAAGAARGEPTPMYPGGDAGRAAEIEAGAGRSADELRADVAGTAAELDRVWASLAGPAWDVAAVTRVGRSPLWRLVQSRWREIEIHWVDLDIGYGPADWPAAFVAPLLPALADPDRLGPRLPAGLAVELEATDSGRRWSARSPAPSGSGATPVRGPSWALVAWLVGRPGAVRQVLPDPPRLAPWA
jgi:maleylpyruvate isomerase